MNRLTNFPSDKPLISPRWLLGALGVVGLSVAVCVYLTLCLLFWQGQFQLVFQPVRTITLTPASDGLHYDDISFDTTETGAAQLDGWWIPAGQPTRTVLILHDGDGCLSDTVFPVLRLHRLGLNVFAFDYRGFGKSANLHPSESSINADADAAWNYLTQTRHLAPSSIVLYGIGLGAAIAAETARRHPEAPALIMEAPRPPLLETLKFQRLARLLPIRLLFHDRFDAGRTLAALQIPKLVLRRDAFYDIHLRSFLQH